MHGTPVVAGAVHAPAIWVRTAALPTLDVPDLDEAERPAERQAASEAAAAVSQRLWDRAEEAEGSTRDILAVQASLASDPAWLNKVDQQIAEGTPAPQAFVQVTTVFAERFSQAGPHMAERTTDLFDVRNRVLAELSGEPEPGIPDVEEPSILLAHDLSPADTSGLDPKKYVGIASQHGGPTSHASILARQLGIPAIVAARSIDRIEDGEMILLDGSTGTIWLGFDDDQVEDVLERERQSKREISRWSPPGQTADGTRVRLMVNVSDMSEPVEPLCTQSQGIGLLRTEMEYLTTRVEPTVSEQAERLERVFRTAGDQRVVVRTLDAGSDKPIPFLPLEAEENPALGMRGIRVSRQYPDTFTRQLDAIQQAAEASGNPNVWVMAPMVSTVAEAEECVQMVHDRGLVGGVMIEVPSVALVAERLMRVVDFVSIGTNDLAQYTLASDRLSPELAEYTDAWQPAVLRLIHLVGLAGDEFDKPVGVCGEAAADPLLACVLVGFGVDSLSMAAPAIPRVGAALSRVTIGQCRRAALATLAAGSPAEARQAALRELNTA